MKKTLKLLWLLLALGGTFNIQSLHAQVTPTVTSSLSVNPVRSPYLSDLTNSSTGIVNLMLLLNDWNEAEVPVRIGLSIEGAGIVMKTNKAFMRTQKIVNLPNNIPQYFFNEDLAMFFNPYNMDFEGIDKNAFIQNGSVIPEGFYTICFQAYDAATGTVPYGRPACATFSVRLFEPPMVLSPNSAFQTISPIQFPISWTTEMPPLADATYLLEIWESSRRLTPQQVIQSQSPIIREQVPSISYLYSAVNPPLEFDKTYFIRVGVEGVNRAAFRNQGFSDLVFFTPQRSTSRNIACSPPDGLAMNVNDDVDGFLVSWLEPDVDASTAIDGYDLQWKRRGDEHPWNTPSMLNNDIITYDITDLTDHDFYQVQLRTVCSNGVSGWMEVEALLSSDEYYCGLPIQAYPIEDQTPLPALAVEEQFFAGDFPITVTQVSGSNGIYFGKGFIDIPYLNGARVNVKFNGIRINDDRYMYAGKVVVTGAGIQIIGGEMADILGDILTTLETVDDILAAAETILQTLDDIIAQMENYLDPAVIQQLTDAQNALANAQNNYNNIIASGDTTGLAAAEQALEDAGEQLGEANDAYTQALAEFVQRLVNIIVESLRQLKNEYIESKDQKHQDHISSEQNFDNFITSTNAINFPTPSGSDITGMIILDSGSEDLTDQLPQLRSQSATLDEYMTKSTDYFIKQNEYSLVIVLEALEASIANQEDALPLMNALKNIGTDLLDYIGVRIRDGQTNEEIIPGVKTEIVNGLTTIIQKGS